MDRTERSEDFIDGLQTAYKVVAKLKDEIVNQTSMRILAAALVAIDREIDKAVAGDAREKKLIVL